mgnify:CR=1 FL=1
MKIKKVTVFGTGNLGARIAFHIAYNKIDVTVYDQDYGLLEEARTKFREFADEYRKDFDAAQEDVETALANIAYSMDITEAAGNADLIIEAIPEKLALKKDFYNKLQKTAPKNAIFATTSAGLDPVELSEASGRVGKFVNFHFSGSKNPAGTSEIICLPTTNPAIVETITQFAKELGMQVIVKKLEQQD